MTDSTIFVVSFNGGHFRRGIPPFIELLEEIRRVAGRPWDIIILQEAVDENDESQSLADDITQALNDRTKQLQRRGEHYAAYWDRLTPDNPEAFQDPVVIYNAARLRRLASYPIPIPQPKRYTFLSRFFALELQHLPLWKRLFTKERPKKRTVCGMTLTLDNGSAPFDVMSMHLEAWGGNAFRRRQFLYAVHARRAYGAIGFLRLLVGADTNVYAPWYLPSARLQRKELRDFLRDGDLKDPSRERTHYYTRMPNGFIRLLGRLRLLVPSKFDVIAAENMPIIRYGTVEAVVDGKHVSDHDAPWAFVDVG